jgi:hypothetical protein
MGEHPDGCQGDTLTSGGDPLRSAEGACIWACKTPEARRSGGVLMCEARAAERFAGRERITPGSSKPGVS